MRGGCEADRTSSAGARATQNIGGYSDKDCPRAELDAAERKKRGKSSGVPHARTLAAGENHLHQIYPAPDCRRMEYTFFPHPASEVLFFEITFFEDNRLENSEFGA